MRWWSLELPFLLMAVSAISASFTAPCVANHPGSHLFLYLVFPRFTACGLPSALNTLF